MEVLGLLGFAGAIFLILGAFRGFSAFRRIKDTQEDVKRLESRIAHLSDRLARAEHGLRSGEGPVEAETEPVIEAPTPGPVRPVAAPKTLKAPPPIPPAPEDEVEVEDFVADAEIPQQPTPIHTAADRPPVLKPERIRAGHPAFSGLHHRPLLLRGVALLPMGRLVDPAAAHIAVRRREQPLALETRHRRRAARESPQRKQALERAPIPVFLRAGRSRFDPVRLRTVLNRAGRPRDGHRHLGTRPRGFRRRTPVGALRPRRSFHGGFTIYWVGIALRMPIRSIRRSRRRQPLRF